VGLDPDSPEFTMAHQRIVERKKLVRLVFADFCNRCRRADDRYFEKCAATARVELGSGAGLMKRLYPDVITSDIKTVRFIDLVARGEELPFRDGTLRALYGINVFHHLADPQVFFSELTRVVAPGGGCVLIEPYYGPFARLLFRNLFTTESYDTEGPSWQRHDRDRPASEANQALSYIIFRRDHALWTTEFPELQLVADEPHTHLSYLASGGVNFRQLVPTPLGQGLNWLERRLGFLDGVLALQHTVVIRRSERLRT
jgi:SAM-dependent methyltransferase